MASEGGAGGQGGDGGDGGEGGGAGFGSGPAITAESFGSGAVGPITTGSAVPE